MALKINWDTATVYDTENRCTYFMKRRFKDGTIMAFYSRSPWSRSEDQERGWVVIDPVNKVVLSQCETFYHGFSYGEYNDWIKEQKQLHSGYAGVIRDENGYVNKMTV